MGVPSLAVEEIGAFGRRLLDQVPNLRDLPRKVFRFHGLTVGVRSAVAEYLALCDRALVDDPADVEPRTMVDITVIDRSMAPRVPHARLVAGEILGDEIDKGFLEAGLEGLFVRYGESWQVFDPAAANGVESFESMERLVPWERSTPLCNFLHWSFQSVGMRLVHAGTLACDGVGVMIAGASGAGKSGTVLAGILGGLDSTGDDYVALEMTPEAACSYPVVRVMKQDRAGLLRLGLDPDDGFGLPTWHAKYEFDFERLGRGRRARSVRLVGIVLPQVTGAVRSGFAPVSSREAAMAIIPSNLQQLPGGRLQGVRFAAELARRLPAFRMTLSADPAEIAGAVRDLIARLAR